MPDWPSPIAPAYDADRPEPYFAVAARAGDVQPDNAVRHAAPVQARLTEAHGAPVPTLDLGCGYGAFDPVARFFGTAGVLYRAAATGALDEPACLPVADGPLADAPIVGLDVAAPAARYAEAAGFVGLAYVFRFEPR